MRGKGNLVSGYVFGRGSHVLEYWLTNAEGFAVRSGGSRLGVVRGVVIDPARGRASALVVRSPLLHRRRTVLAREVEAVDPAARLLEVEPATPVERPEPWVADTLIELATRLDRFLDRTLTWVRPRVHVLANRTVAAAGAWASGVASRLRSARW
jgi:hypothetical protein